MKKLLSFLSSISVISTLSATTTSCVFGPSDAIINPGEVELMCDHDFNIEETDIIDSSHYNWDKWDWTAGISFIKGKNDPNIKFKITIDNPEIADGMDFGIEKDNKDLRWIKIIPKNYGDTVVHASYNYKLKDGTKKTASTSFNLHIKKPIISLENNESTNINLTKGSDEKLNFRIKNCSEKVEVMAKILNDSSVVKLDSFMQNDVTKLWEADLKALTIGKAKLIVQCIIYGDVVANKVFDITVHGEQNTNIYIDNKGSTSVYVEEGKEYSETFGFKIESDEEIQKKYSMEIKSSDPNIASASDIDCDQNKFKLTFKKGGVVEITFTLKYTNRAGYEKISTNKVEYTVSNEKPEIDLAEKNLILGKNDTTISSAVLKFNIKNLKDANFKVTSEKNLIIDQPKEWLTLSSADGKTIQDYIFIKSIGEDDLYLEAKIHNYEFKKSLIGHVTVNKVEFKKIPDQIIKSDWKSFNLSFKDYLVNKLPNIDKFKVFSYPIEGNDSLEFDIDGKNESLSLKKIPSVGKYVVNLTYVFDANEVYESCVSTKFTLIVK